MTGPPAQRVVVACSGPTWERFRSDEELRRLARLAELHVELVDVQSGWTEPPLPAPEAEARVISAAQGAVAVLICHGSPLIGGELLDQVPTVRFVGELEGDRFASRIDLPACWSRGIRVVDTNNSMSYPVAEWALALMLMGLRDYGSLWRKMVVDRVPMGPGRPSSDFGFVHGELSGKTIGLVGFGHIARRLVELLQPFRVQVYAHDPYVPIEVADASGVVLTSLDNVVALSDLVCCLVPLTPATRGLLGAGQIELLKPGTVFVNVSRGAVVDHGALLDRLRRGDVVACLDVFDPEPVPVDSPFLDLPNVVLSPHIASATAASSPRSLHLMVDELERYLAGHQTRFDLLPRTLENRRGFPPGSQQQVSAPGT
ncbi:MAG TPA: hydroxyacid dehydrogenase [Acidimicrobiales bacterium]|nr:hydroxyacid dehydrogenase [Acidimicrobiales bacterium]